MVVSDPPIKVVWAPEFLKFPNWAAGADLMFAEAPRVEPADPVHRRRRRPSRHSERRPRGPGFIESAAWSSPTSAAPLSEPWIVGSGFRSASSPGTARPS